ncbi:hypothetical protein Baya_0206 [Bagarius yarrelli]|uniref:Uncharacterized protein n=1 Tax=Bagarius yarrelli TaxID=175774 RepID=A0A556THL7_BAGYA|nr:hypothetical protein Baya_0206 [Bagarius yarrelli]
MNCKLRLHPALRLCIPPGQVRPLFCRSAALQHGRSIGNSTQNRHLSFKIKPAAPAVSLKEMDLPQASQQSRLSRDHVFKRAVFPVPAKQLNHQSVPPDCFQGCLPVCAIQQRHINLPSIGQLESPMLGAEDVRILASEVIRWVFIKHMANCLVYNFFHQEKEAW